MKKYKVPKAIFFYFNGKFHVEKEGKTCSRTIFTRTKSSARRNYQVFMYPIRFRTQCIIFAKIINGELFMQKTPFKVFRMGSK